LNEWKQKVKVAESQNSLITAEKTLASSQLAPAQERASRSETALKQKESENTLLLAQVTTLRDHNQKLKLQLEEFEKKSVPILDPQKSQFLADFRKKSKKYLDSKTPIEPSKLEKDIENMLQQVTTILQEHAKLCETVERLKNQLAEKDLQHAQHVDQLKTEADQEIHRLTDSLSNLNLQYESKIQQYEASKTYMEFKLAQLASDLTNCQRLLEEQGVDPTAYETIEEGNYLEQNYVGNRNQFVTGTTSLVSSQLMRAYEPPVDDNSTINKNAFENGQKPKKSNKNQNRAGKIPERLVLAEDEILINGQVVKKGTLYEWVV